MKATYTADEIILALQLIGALALIAMFGYYSIVSYKEYKEFKAKTRK